MAQDLAPVFADTPWLDIPPNEEGQAALLRGLEMMTRTVFEAALKRLGPSTHQAQSTAAVATSADGPLTRARPVTAAAGKDPKRFLLQIMIDDTVALALRIDAAKALLEHSNNHRPQQSD